jgi:hypothetical protein
MRPRSLWSVVLGALIGVLCVTLAVGPAAADPRVRVAQADPDDEDDVPAPPPPPAAPAQAPAELAPPEPTAPPPAAVILTPGAVQLQYGGIQVPPAVLYARGQSLRSVGMPLTFVGIGLFVAMIALFVKAVDEGTCAGTWDGTSYVHNCNDSLAADYVVGGALALLGSLVSLGVGIPLWAIGSSRMNKAVRMGYQPAYAAPFLSPTPGGLVAGLRIKSF